MGGKQSLQDLKISRRKKERRGRVREEGQVNDPHFNVFNAGKLHAAATGNVVRQTVATATGRGRKMSG